MKSSMPSGSVQGELRRRYRRMRPGWQPAATLFRGDNVVTLSAPGGERSARLREVSYRVVAP